MRRLRIALIASARFPIREPFAGGLEAHTWVLARGLKRRGHRVTVFAAPDAILSSACASCAPSGRGSVMAPVLMSACPPGRGWKSITRTCSC